MNPFILSVIILIVAIGCSSNSAAPSSSGGSGSTKSIDTPCILSESTIQGILKTSDALTINHAAQVNAQFKTCNILKEFPIGNTKMKNSIIAIHFLQDSDADSIYDSFFASCASCKTISVGDRGFLDTSTSYWIATVQSDGYVFQIQLFNLEKLLKKDINDVVIDYIIANPEAVAVQLAQAVIATLP